MRAAVNRIASPDGPNGAAAPDRITSRSASAPFGPSGEAILFTAARIDHIDATIAPALKRGEWVISDRFADSTRAYQGAAGKLDAAMIASLERVALGDLRPDLTLILDLPVAIGMARATERRGRDAKADRFEAEGTMFHETLRRAFLDIAAAEPERCAVVAADRPVDEVARAIWAIVRERLGSALNIEGQKD